MKKLLLFTITLLLLLNLNAQMQGPNSATSFSTVAIAGSDPGIVWTNTGNLALSNDSYASFGNFTAVPVNGYSDYLVVKNFGFTVPAGKVITGIIVEIERSDNLFKAADHSIRIVKANTISTTERSSGQAYPFSDSYQTFGNASDLWGETWTEADINDPDFGVAFAVKRTAPSGVTNGRVDHVRIFVFYSSVLSVNFFSLNAKTKNKVVQLSWTTSEEKNMSHYELERSRDGINFISLLNVKSKNNLANTTYSVNDDNPINGKNFYRIKSVENNGILKYSKIISVDFKTANEIQIFPNPWKPGTSLYINNPLKEKLQIKFFNSMGKLIGTGLVNATANVTNNIRANTKGSIYYRVMNSMGEIKGSGSILIMD